MVKSQARNRSTVGPGTKVVPVSLERGMISLINARIVIQWNMDYTYVQNQD